MTLGWPAAATLAAERSIREGASRHLAGPRGDGGEQRVRRAVAAELRVAPQRLGEIFANQVTMAVEQHRPLEAVAVQAAAGCRQPAPGTSPGAGSACRRGPC